MHDVLQYRQIRKQIVIYRYYRSKSIGYDNDFKAADESFTTVHIFNLNC